MTRSSMLFLAIWFAGSAYAAETLAIDRVVLAHTEDGVPVASDFRFSAGDVVFISCRVSGYTRKGDEPPKMYLTYTVEAKDAKQRLLVPVETGKIAADLTPEDRKWQPKIRFSLALPSQLDPGEYKVIVKAKDEFGQAGAEASAELLIEGRAVAPSETLVVQDFRFLRGEEDRQPLEVAAYRPGDAVWARFDMTGYKLGPGNRYDVEYGLKVFRPGGGITYEQPQAAAEKDESFYPKRYLPGILSLNLPKDLAKGRYRIVLTVKDNLGGQTVDLEKSFDVE